MYLSMLTAYFSVTAHQKNPAFHDLTIDVLNAQISELLNVSLICIAEYLHNMKYVLVKYLSNRCQCSNSFNLTSVTLQGEIWESQSFLLIYVQLLDMTKNGDDTFKNH